MASSYVCRSCRSLLTKRARCAPSDSPLQLHAAPRSAPSSHQRLLSTTAALDNQRPKERAKPQKQHAEITEPSLDPSNASNSQEIRQISNYLRERPSGSKQFSPIQSLARLLRKRAGTTTETYVAYGACERLIKECARQANYKMPQAQKKNVDIPKSKDGQDLGQGEGWWYNNLGLLPTFNSWAQVTFLHMYMLTCRFRMLSPKLAPVWHQHLANQFFFLAEERMTEMHGIAASSVRSKYLKDLFLQWRGLTAGYDEGLAKGDAVLATAVWRNIFKATDDVDFRDVGQVVAYMRAGLRELERVTDSDIEAGSIFFRDPGQGATVVSTGSTLPKR